MQPLKNKENQIVSNTPFIDLTTQLNSIRSNVNSSIKKVLDHGIFIMGPEVFELEKQLSEFCGAKHTISCANGTDALILALMAKNIQNKDAVFVPSFTFAATAEVVALVGATPIFIDSLEDTFNINPKSLEQGIENAKKNGLNPVGIIPVDLFGQPADYDEIVKIAGAYNLWMISDAAQSFGAVYKGKKIGTFGDITTTSFFPAKPLGCYGDGGAIFTDNDDLAEIMKSLRIHGQGKDKYDNIRIGINGRLDTIQAAILLEKLKIFEWELLKREEIAKKYNSALNNKVIHQKILKNVTSTYAQYTVCLSPFIDRDKLISILNDYNIPSVIYYKKPLHLQSAYKHFPTATMGSLPICEHLSEKVLSFPMSAYVKDETIGIIADVFNRF
jgi:dTDP-4-amino-4,6-dideoxygalactose transaminase